MTREAGVFDNCLGLLLTLPGIEILDGRKLGPGDVPGCTHYPLYISSLVAYHCVWHLELAGTAGGLNWREEAEQVRELQLWMPFWKCCSLVYQANMFVLKALSGLRPIKWREFRGYLFKLKLIYFLSWLYVLACQKNITA